MSSRDKLFDEFEELFELKDLENDEILNDEFLDKFCVACSIGSSPQSIGSSPQRAPSALLNDSIIETPDGFSMILSPSSHTKPLGAVFDTPQSSNSKAESKKETFPELTSTKKNEHFLPKLSTTSESSNGSTGKENQSQVESTTKKEGTKKPQNLGSSQWYQHDTPIYYTGPRTRSRAKADDHVSTTSTS